MNEKYLTRIKHSHSSKTSFEVWVNPTSKELRNIGRYIRFIADNKGKKLYAWSNDGPLHEDAWEQISKRDLKSDVQNGNIIPGGSTRGKMYSSDGMDYLGNFMDNNLYNSDNTLNDGGYRYINSFKWADKYIDITTYLMGKL